MAKKSNSRLGSSEFIRWFRPLIDCLQELGAARPREASDWIAEKERIPSEQREASLKSGEERFHNQVQFARQYLVWEGLNDGGKKGIWSLTPLGARTRLNDEEARSICRKWVKFHAAARTGTKGKNENYTPSTSSPVAVDLHPDEKTEDVGLLNVLRGLSATGFEHFCRHLLLDYEFEKVTVTKRSGDDGIDGVGILQLNPPGEFGRCLSMQALLAVGWKGRCFAASQRRAAACRQGHIHHHGLIHATGERGSCQGHPSR